MRSALRLAACALLAAAAGACASGGGAKQAGAEAGGSRTAHLLATTCSNCHRTPRPETMSAERWQAGLDRMKHKVTLSAADWDSLAALGRPDPAPGASVH